MDNTTVSKELQRFNITDAAIRAMEEKYMPLTIAGLDDKDGLAAVHIARMVVKNKRIEVEKVRKALKEACIKFGRIVDGEAKRITALLEPIESHLEAEENKIAVIKAQIKAEEERKVREAEESRLKALEEARLAEIERQRKEDEAFLAAVAAAQAAEKARLAEIARAQDEQEKALRAERERIEAEKRAIARERELEQARREAAEQARREAQEEVAAEKRAMEQKLRESELAKERAIQAERKRVEAERLAAEQARIEAELVERERLEAERRAAEALPDIAKLLALAEQIENLEIPTLVTAEAKQVLELVIVDLGSVVTNIRFAVENIGANHG